MRNLRNIRYETCRCAAEITSACWDATEDEVLVTFGPNETDGKIELARVTSGVASRPWDLYVKSPFHGTSFVVTNMKIANVRR